MSAISQETEKPRRRRRREARARSWAREVSPGTESRTCYRRRSLSPTPATYSTPFSANTLPSPLWHLICQPIHQLTQQLLLTRQFIVQLLFVWPLNWLSNTFLPNSTLKSQLWLLAFICLLSHFIQDPISKVSTGTATSKIDNWSEVVGIHRHFRRIWLFTSFMYENNDSTMCLCVRVKTNKTDNWNIESEIV